LVSKHIRLGWSIWRFVRFRRALKRDPNAVHYTDAALAPVLDEDLDSFEMFSSTAAARDAAAKVRHLVKIQ